MNAGPLPVFSVVVFTVLSEVSDTKNVINKYFLGKLVNKSNVHVQA